MHLFNVCARLWAWLLTACWGFAQGASVNVLWYTYSDPASEYRAGIAEIAANAHTYPQSSGLQWNLTFFGPGEQPAGGFGAYQVLVIHSGEPFRTGPAPGPPFATPDYSGILGNKAAIVAARGDRTFLSGTDGDFHALRRDTGNLTQTDPNHWDGALGYVVNAVNWAASGNGLGIVAFFDGESAGSDWWEDPNSFLRDELLGKQVRVRDNLPFIPSATANFPLNHGLTALGLSNWNNSFHGRFLMPVSGYTSLVDSDDTGQFSLTLVSSAFAAAPAGPAAPVIDLSPDQYSVNEDAGSVTVTVARTGGSAGAVSVEYATSDGTAVATADYIFTSGKLTFGDGDTTPKTIVIQIRQDTSAEPDKSFSLALSNPSSSAVLGAHASAQITIKDHGAPAANPVGSSGGGGGGCTLAPASGFDPTLVLLLGVALVSFGLRRRGNLAGEETCTDDHQTTYPFSRAHRFVR